MCVKTIQWKKITFELMKNINYMNSAGSSIMSDSTVSAIIDYLKLEQEIGGYEAMFAKQSEFEIFYERARSIVNAASVDEIAYTDGGSRGWNALINGLDISLIDAFITLSSEYSTNITTLQLCAQKYGKVLHIIPCDIQGDFDMAQIKELANNERCCIAVSQATAQGSICNPMEEIGEIAKATQSIYIVDATQSIGQIPIDVQSLHCHAMTATGRKWLRGPRGTGFIYVKEGAPFFTTSVDGSSSKAYRRNGKVIVEQIKTARQFEMWERNYGLMLGLSNAIQEYIDYGITDVHHRVRDYANQIRSAVVSNDHLQLIGRSDSASGIIGIVAHSEAIHDAVLSSFKANDITINIMYEWACPLFFDRETKVIRIAAHHDVSQRHIDKVTEVLSGIG